MHRVCATVCDKQTSIATNNRLVTHVSAPAQTTNKHEPVLLNGQTDIPMNPRYIRISN